MSYFCENKSHSVAHIDLDQPGNTDWALACSDPAITGIKGIGLHLLSFDEQVLSSDYTYQPQD